MQLMLHTVALTSGAHGWVTGGCVCREDLDADFSVRERVRWGDPMAHLAHKKLAEAGPPPPVLPAHLQQKTGDAPVNQMHLF
jgi:hypothetical protein